MAGGRGRTRESAESLARPPASPPARRLRRARLGDLRLWLGLVLVAGSMLVGARLMGADDDTVVVLRATRDLAVGAGLDGLAPVRVSRAAAGDLYLEGPAPDGVLRWPVQAGELVPRSAVASGPRADSRLVTVPVDPLHAPPALQRGSLVDVWSVPGDPEQGEPGLVLPAVSVADVSTDALGMGGELAVVLDVPSGQVAAVVDAARGGGVDLVAVPASSQSADAGDAAPSPSPVPVAEGRP